MIDSIPPPINEFLTELETLDLCLKNDVWDLRHYNQNDSNYAQTIETKANEVKKLALWLDAKNIGVLLTELKRIQKNYTEFWKFYQSQKNAYLEGNFDIWDFATGIESFFRCDAQQGLEFEADRVVSGQYFWDDLRDMATLRSGALYWLINQIEKAYNTKAENETEQIPTKTTNNDPIKLPPRTVQKNQNYLDYTKKYIDLRKTIFCKRESAIEKILKEFNISEKTLARAFEQNADLLVNTGHERKKFDKYSRIKF